jgi:hypothetical protein
MPRLNGAYLSITNTEGFEVTVREILRKYLEDSGYDGLYGDGCGCGLDDLFCCEGDTYGWFVGDCEPAYLRPCLDCKYADTCEDLECSEFDDRDMFFPTRDCRRTREAVEGEAVTA